MYDFDAHVALTAEQYTFEAIREVPFPVLLAEYRDRLSDVDQIKESMDKVLFEGDMTLAFSLASALGFTEFKVQLLEIESQRRDVEEGPVSDEDRDQVMLLLLAEALKQGLV